MFKQPITVTVEGESYLNRFECDLGPHNSKQEWAHFFKQIRYAIEHARLLATPAEENK